MTTVHSEIKLYFKDILGNESSEYKIGHKDDASSAWWILDNLLTDEGTTVAAAAAWAADTDAVFNVKPPVGSIIRSVGVKVNTTVINGATVSFAGYDGNPTQPMSNGWVTLSADGLTVTVPKEYLKKDWDPKSVTITLNDTVSKTISDFVPTKEFGADDISWNAQTWESGNTVKIPFTLENGAGIDKITKIATDVQSVTIEKITEDGQNKFKLTGSFAQTWEDQVINIIINDTITKKALTIPSFKLGDHADDISWNKATWVSGTASYEIPITLGSGVPVSKLEGITVTAAGITNVTAAVDITDTAHPKFVLSKVPTAQGWNKQVATISISGNTVKDTITKDAIEINARLIKANNISWGTIPSWNASNSSYEIPITLVKGDASTAPDISKLSNMTFTASVNGTVNSDITVTLNSSTKKFVISGEILKVQGWDAQKVSINISGDNIDGTITQETITITAKKLSNDDITLTSATWTSGATSYDVGITMNGGDSAPSINKLDGMTFDAYIGSTKKTNITITLDKTTPKFTVTGNGIPTSQSFDNSQDISIKISGDNIVSSGITQTAVSIPKKDFDASCITITPGAEWTDDWASASITVNSELAMSGIESINTKMFTISTPSYSNGKKTATLTLTKYTGDGAVAPTKDGIKITVTTAKGSATQGVYVSLSAIQNRFFGRSVSIKGLEEIYNFVEPPGSVAAMQSRIIKLPSTVQKAWESFTTDSEDVTENITPITEVTPSVKSAKPSIKKSTKKLEESVPAAEQAVADVAATIPLEVTELSAETLVAPAPEDAVAMLLPQSANTKQVEPQASIAPTLVETAATTTADEAPQDNLVLKLIIALAALVLCGVFGLTLLLKKKSVKEN